MGSVRDCGHLAIERDSLRGVVLTAIAWHRLSAHRCLRE